MFKSGTNRGLLDVNKQGALNLLNMSSTLPNYNHSNSIDERSTTIAATGGGNNEQH